MQGFGQVPGFSPPRTLGMWQLDCRHCGRQFSAARTSSVYCSVRCRVAARTVARRDTVSVRQAAEVARAPRAQTCPHCLSTFFPGVQPKVFCSARCRTAAGNRRTAAGRRVDIPARPCRRCGTEFVPVDSHVAYCAAECRTIARRERQRHDPVGHRTCPQCATSFAPLNFQIVYCGDRCRVEAKRARVHLRQHLPDSRTPDPMSRDSAASDSLPSSSF